MNRCRKLQGLASVSAIALIAVMGSASADTITVFDPSAWSSGAPPMPYPFSLVNFGTASTGNSLQSSATISNPGGGISSITFNASSNPASGLSPATRQGTFLRHLATLTVPPIIWWPGDRTLRQGP